MVAAHSCWLAESGRYGCGSILRGAPCSKHHLLVSRPWKEQTKLASTQKIYRSAWLTHCSRATHSYIPYLVESLGQQSSYPVGPLSPDSMRSTVDSITASAAARGSPHRCFRGHQQRTSSAGKSNALFYQTCQTISVIVKQWTKWNLVQMPREQVHRVSIHGKATPPRGGAAFSIATKEPWCLPYLNVRCDCKFAVLTTS